MEKSSTYKFRILGLIDVEMSEFSSYELKDVAQSLYKVWQQRRELEGGPITWDLFKMSFLGWFFPRCMKEGKVDKFINLMYDLMLVRDYSMRFVRLYILGGHLVGSVSYFMGEKV